MKSLSHFILLVTLVLLLSSFKENPNETVADKNIDITSIKRGDLIGSFKVKQIDLEDGFNIKLSGAEAYEVIFIDPKTGRLCYDISSLFRSTLQYEDSLYKLSKTPNIYIEDSKTVMVFLDSSYVDRNDNQTLFKPEYQKIMMSAYIDQITIKGDHNGYEISCDIKRVSKFGEDISMIPSDSSLDHYALQFDADLKDMVQTLSKNRESEEPLRYDSEITSFELYKSSSDLRDYVNHLIYLGYRIDLKGNREYCVETFKPQLGDNAYYIKSLKVGDNISGFKVESLSYDRWSFEISLSGSLSMTGSLSYDDMSGSYTFCADKGTLIGCSIVTLCKDISPKFCDCFMLNQDILEPILTEEMRSFLASPSESMENPNLIRCRVDATGISRSVNCDSYGDCGLTVANVTLLD